ncbi:hypothetical protein X777_05418, partial [Ooceraea biroi]
SDRGIEGLSESAGVNRFFARVKELTHSACTHLRKLDEVGVRLDEYHHFYSCAPTHLQKIAGNHFSRAEDIASITVLNRGRMRDRIYTPRALYVARASPASTKCKT